MSVLAFVTQSYFFILDSSKSFQTLARLLGAQFNSFPLSSCSIWGYLVKRIFLHTWFERQGIGANRDKTSPVFLNCLCGCCIKEFVFIYRFAFVPFDMTCTTTSTGTIKCLTL